MKLELKNLQIEYGDDKSLDEFRSILMLILDTLEVKAQGNKLD